MNDEILSEKAANKKPSVLGMITSPTEQFRRIKSKPEIIIGLMVITVLAVINIFLLMPAMEVELVESLKEAGDIGDISGLANFTKIVSVVTALIIPTIAALITAVVFLVIGKIANSTVNFGTLFSMAIYIGIISSLGGLVNGIIIALTGTMDSAAQFTSLQTLFNVKGAFGGIFLSLEVFSIWKLIITAIGMQIIIGLSKKVSWTLVIVYFVLIMLLSIGSLALLEVFGGAL